MSEIIIIKDPKDEIYYATLKSEYDCEHETTIIAWGVSELEAYEHGSDSVTRALHECQTRLKEIGESLCNPRDFYLEEKFFAKRCAVEIPLNLENSDQIIESFDAMSYDKETNQWYRFYR